MECWCFWNPMATVCQYTSDLSDILVPSCWVGPSLFGVQEMAGVGQIQASRWSRKAVLFYSWGVCWSCWILPLLTTFVVMSMSQDTFPRDVQTSVHNMVPMVSVLPKCWLTHMKQIRTLRLVLHLTLHHHFWTIWCLR
jgi:hypothetical protein